ncbi:MAG: ParA family protein [Planctomycetota bacterium]
MKRIAIYHMKGGVGKTTAAVNLAYESAARGWRTLLCDLDPQGSSSYYLRVRASERLESKTLVKGGRRLQRAVVASDHPGLDLLPSAHSFRDLDLVLHERERPRRALRRSLEELGRDYDVVLLDCPPNLTLGSEVVLRAAHRVLVPLVPTTLSWNTYQLMLELARERRLRPGRLLPFFSMVDERKTLHRDTMRAIEAAAPELCRTTIPARACVEAMGVHRRPVACFAPGDRASQAFAALWAEVEERAGLRTRRSEAA